MATLSLVTDQPATVDVGDTVTASILIKDDAGAAASATTVVLTVTAPDDTTSTPTVTETTTGTYEADVVVAQAGSYVLAWTATGVNANAATDTILVRDPTWIPPVSLSQVKAFLNMTGSSEDEELRRFIDAATDAGELYTGRVFGRRTITATIDNAAGKTTLALPHLPAISVTSVVEDGQTLTGSDYRADLYPAVLTRLSGGQPTTWATSGVVTVTYLAGYVVQPATDVQGLLELVKHKRKSQLGSIRPNRGGDEQQYDPDKYKALTDRVTSNWDLNRVDGFA